MENIKGLEYRIKQKDNKYYPQYKFGFRTLWCWEYFVDYHDVFVKLNNLQNVEGKNEYWRMFFYNFEDARKYIDTIKKKHFNKYYRKIIKI